MLEDEVFGCNDGQDRADRVKFDDCAKGLLVIHILPLREAFGYKLGFLTIDRAIRIQFQRKDPTILD